MASTRFNYDEARTRKRLEESTFAGRYALDTPGPGIMLPFMEDPQIRLQYWGANQQTNTISLENELLGLGRPLQPLDVVNYRDNMVKTKKVLYGTQNDCFVDESRATHPAWMYRDLEHSRWEKPFLNPQSLRHIEPDFKWDVSTRLEQRR